MGRRGGKHPFRVRVLKIRLVIKTVETAPKKVGR